MLYPVEMDSDMLNRDVEHGLCLLSVLGEEFSVSFLGSKIVMIICSRTQLWENSQKWRLFGFLYLSYIQLIKSRDGASVFI